MRATGLGQFLMSIELGILRRVPHGPALCARRLGTLDGQRSLSGDLARPTSTPFTQPRFGGSVGICDPAGVPLTSDGLQNGRF
jgi:hypothetical protein